VYGLVTAVSRRIRAIRAIGFLVCVLISAPGAGQSEAVVARVLGEEIACASLRALELDACALALLRHVRMRVEQDYVRRHALAATAAEVNALRVYNDRFERHDRAQRARKLVEIEARLARMEEANEDRSRLLAFRDILLRLARYEADVDAGTEQRETPPIEALQAWIETAKLNTVLYTRYGGAVGLAPSGPYAHGARSALVADYIERGEVVLLDAEVGRRFLAALQAPPRLLHPPGVPDFTPFWERPILPSYVPD
jgi:hypothetical protein